MHNYEKYSFFLFIYSFLLRWASIVYLFVSNKETKIYMINMLSDFWWFIDLFILFRLTVQNFSDTDVTNLLSALGEGKHLRELK